MKIATKSDPKLWERAKAAACAQARLCDHSARKMQWATRYYKQHGGKYAGKRSKKNSLRAWSRQRWRTHSGRPSQGRLRYLPDRAWAKLSPDQVRRTNAAKARGSRRGKQWVRQPADVRAALDRK